MSVVPEMPGIFAKRAAAYIQSYNLPAYRCIGAKTKNMIDILRVYGIIRGNNDYYINRRSI